MVLLKHKDLVDPSSCPLHSYENIKRENASCSAKASSATVDKELPRRQVQAKRLPFTVTRVLNLWPVRLRCLRSYPCHGGRRIGVSKRVRCNPICDAWRITLSLLASSTAR